MLSTRSASPGTPMDRVEDALAALREGRTVIVVDDESRENEGDLILPAQSATTEQAAFAIRHSTGIICAPMAGQEPRPPGHPHDDRAQHRSQEDGLHPERRRPHRHHHGCERRRPGTYPPRPGGPGLRRQRPRPPRPRLPLRAREGGILTRRGHTEAAVDLMRLSGNRPVGVLVEVINDDGTMARRHQAREPPTPTPCP